MLKVALCAWVSLGPSLFKLFISAHRSGITHWLNFWGKLWCFQASVIAEGSPVSIFMLGCKIINWTYKRRKMEEILKIFLRQIFGHYHISVIFSCKPFWWSWGGKVASVYSMNSTNLYLYLVLQAELPWMEQGIWYKDRIWQKILCRMQYNFGEIVWYI